VRGWVYRANSPREALVIALYDNERFVAAAPANIPRQDLAAAGHGPCGFELAIPDTLFDDQRHELDLRVAGTAQSLLAQPVLIELGSSAKPVAGHSGGSKLPSFPTTANRSDANSPSTIFTDGQSATGGGMSAVTRAPLYPPGDIELLAQSAMVSREAADIARDGIARTVDELTQRSQRLRRVFDELQEALSRS
jgi:hypothetical protein